jgi:hypothetical protein
MNHFLAIWAALIVFGVLRLSGTAQRVVLGRFSRHLLVQLVQDNLHRRASTMFARSVARLSLIWTLVALSVGFAASQSTYSYYGYSIRQDSQITIVGFRDGTQYEITNLNTRQPMSRGVLNRGQSTTFTVGSPVPFKIASNHPISAHLWYDCCNFLAHGYRVHLCGSCG